MKIKILLMVVVLAGLLFCLSASAVITNPSCGTVPEQQINYQKSTTVDKFDSSLGCLKSVTINVTACGNGSRIVTNTDQNPDEVYYTAILTAIMTTNIPGVGEEDLQIEKTDNFHLGTGESYTIVLDRQCDTRVITLTTPAEMAPYIGNAGDKVLIFANTSSKITMDGSTEWSSTGSTFMGVTICVVYEYELLCIGGTKTRDCEDEDEPVEGTTINLKNSAGAIIKTTVTEADGTYSFCDLKPGSYTVEEVLPAGWVQISAPGPITLACEDVPDQDFVNQGPLCIEGYKLNNLGDTGLEGWTINLKDAAGKVIETATTDSTGKYKFCRLMPGTYTVCEVMQPGWTAVGDTCIPVPLDCEDSTDNDFMNQREAEEVCETAWAFLDGGSCWAKTGNWGWLVELPKNTIQTGRSFDISGIMWAGAAKCETFRGTNVGTMTITVSANGYVVDFDLNDDCHVEDLHVWVSNTKPLIKGGFSDKHWYKFESMDGLDLDLTKPIWVAVHTSTCCSACDNEEVCTYPAPK